MLVLFWKALEHACIANGVWDLVLFGFASGSISGSVGV